MNSRNFNIDILKSIAIFLVVLGHSIQYGSGTTFLVENSFYWNPVFKVIYSFHMPLFMLISGYLFAHSISRDEHQFIKKIRTLIVPIFVWTLLEFIYYNVVKTQSTLSWNLALQYFDSALRHFWFLWAVFFCSAIVIAVRKYLKDSLIAYGLVIAITLLIPDYANIELYKYMFPYFVIGYFSPRFDMNNSVTKFIFSWGGIISLLVLDVFLLLFYSVDSYIYTSEFTVIRNGIFSVNYLLIDVYRFMVGLLGSLFMIALTKKSSEILPDFSKKIFEFLGKNTLGIYVISYYLNIVLRKYSSQINGVNYGLSLIETVLILLVSSLIIICIKQSKIARKYLLGVIK